MSHERATSRLHDHDDRYGWLSIALHWLVAIAVIALWIVGKSIPDTVIETADAWRALHMSIGINGWFLIAIRVAWRVGSGHPRVQGVSAVTHRFAKLVHYALLVAISVMLLTGPLMPWVGGSSIPVFGWFSIPGPLAGSEALRKFAHAIHVISANVLFWLTLFVIGGAFKHPMFHADDVFVRVLWPGKRPTADSPEDG